MKKSIYSYSLVYVLLVFLVTPALPAPWLGSGTSYDPYQIASPNDLEAIGPRDNHYDKYFIMTADIDLAGRTYYQAIIAPDTDPNTTDYFDGPTFEGNFNGDGHCISNFQIARPSGVPDHKLSCCGLFGGVLNCTIKNLHLKNVSFDTSCDVTNYTGQYVNIGALVGKAGYSSIRNCSAQGRISLPNTPGGVYCESIGLLAGGVKETIVRNCQAFGKINAQESVQVGGLVGEVVLNSNISGCSADTSVFGCERVGGFAGFVKKSTVDECSSKSTVLGYKQVGGFAGAANNSTITQSSSQAFIQADYSSDYTAYGTGGLLGDAIASSVSNCCAKGTVIADNKTGGLVGFADLDSSIEYSYAATRVLPGSGVYGGIVGGGSNASYTGNYFDTWASGLDYGLGSDTTMSDVQAKTTIEMKKQTTFASWDFENTWFIEEEKTYPTLRFQAAGYLGDSNLDGKVNFLDLAILAQNWLQDI